MAMACLFVAAKIEEDCRKIRDVVNVFHHLSQKRTGRYVLSVLCSIVKFCSFVSYLVVELGEEGEHLQSLCTCRSYPCYNIFISASSPTVATVSHM